VRKCGGANKASREGSARGEELSLIICTRRLACRDRATPQSAWRDAQSSAKSLSDGRKRREREEEEKWTA